MLEHWILIILLAASTYITRIVGVESMASREMSATLRLYFQYVPVAIMAALIVTQMVTPTDSGHVTVSLPVLIGCVATGIAIQWSKHFLPSVIIGIVIGVAARMFLN